MVQRTLPQASKQHNRPHDQAPGRSLRDLALETEALWGHALRERPQGLTIDTTKMSLLRVAHRVLAAAADVEEMEPFR
jgi:hypothetical protein